ncbi:MAG: winged helix-turn-helix domain-containing protein [Caulobacteraceae bacterium]
MHRKATDQGGDAIELTASERSVRLGGVTLPLPPREFRLLEHLMAHPGEVIGVERLQENAWGEASEPQPELVRAVVSRLRRRLRTLSPLPMIVTVAGHGYVFRAPETAGGTKMKNLFILAHAAV